MGTHQHTLGLVLGTLLAAVPAWAAEKEAINRAIDHGVAALRKMQRKDGSWPEPRATALAGLALLECKVPASDPAIVKAAAVIRTAALRHADVYTVALAILFLDRLGDARDVPLIESLAVRLLAAQTPKGNWDYVCPPIAPSEVRRLGALLRQQSELKGGRKLPRVDPRTPRDLPPEIQAQLALLNRQGPTVQRQGDNSNTQFATLALWVARRHGLPAETALRRVEVYFRQTQLGTGTWAYRTDSKIASPAMTCAGVLGLTVAHGFNGGRNLARDPALRAGLLALWTTIGHPFPDPRAVPRIDQRNGKAYYFLWSLERVAVALGLEKIGKKDWYNWGADVLLANQRADGTWQGEYAESGADTCFALLFLRRSNLAGDLTARLGKVKDLGEAELKAGGVGGRRAIKPALDPQDRETAPDRRSRDPEGLEPIPAEVENAVARRLSDGLVRATGAEQQRLLERLRDSKGVDHTEALLLALPRLEGEARQRVRDALAQRFTRLTAGSLLNYLKDHDAEARQAALRALAHKGLRQHVPAIIGKLSDPEPGVVRAAHAALKTLTGQDFGPGASANREEIDRAIAAWRDWWRKNAR